MTGDLLSFCLCGVAVGLVFGVLGALTLFIKFKSSVDSLMKASENEVLDSKGVKNQTSIDREAALRIIHHDRTLLFASMMSFAAIVLVCVTVIVYSQRPPDGTQSEFNNSLHTGADGRSTLIFIPHGRSLRITHDGVLTSKVEPDAKDLAPPRNESSPSVNPAPPPVKSAASPPPYGPPSAESPPK